MCNDSYIFSSKAIKSHICLHIIFIVCIQAEKGLVKKDKKDEKKEKKRKLSEKGEKGDKGEYSLDFYKKSKNYVSIYYYLIDKLHVSWEILNRNF